MAETVVVSGLTNAQYPSSQACFRSPHWDDREPPVPATNSRGSSASPVPYRIHYTYSRLRAKRPIVPKVPQTKSYLEDSCSSSPREYYHRHPRCIL